MRQLLCGFLYITVRHPQKFIWDFWISPIVGACVFILFVVAGDAANISGNDGFLDQVSGLLSIFSGFFITSLAAVVSFNSDGMDRVMPGQAPTIRGKSGSEDPLTRRRFLCMLFGYLALSSVFLYFFAIFGRLFSGYLLGIISVYILWMMFLIYLIWLSHILVTMLVGVYYMVDRMHRSDPENI